MSLQDKQWKGFHMRFAARAEVKPLIDVIKKALVPLGVNVLLLEINTNFSFQSYPELASGDITKEDIRELAALCQENGISLIPLFECLGHQGWKGSRNTILRVFPEFDETPHIPEDSQDIYCPSWCPLHPAVNPVVFTLIDELIDAFQTEAIHLGMDEVFLIADDDCPRCSGKDPSELFAKAVNDYHDYFVKEKGLEMLIWGDRLIDRKSFPVYDQWEADKFGIAPALALIPKDIIICDWHYFPRDDYPSVRRFLEQGFRVWPACWRIPHAALDFYFKSKKAGQETGAGERMLGMLVTGWNASGESLNAALLGEDDYDPAKDPGQIKDIAETLRTVMVVLNQAE